MAGRFRFKFRNIWKQQTKTAAGDITSTYGYGELYADLDESQMDLAPVYPAPPLSAPPLPAPPLPPARARAVSSPEQPILGEGESDYYVNIGAFPPPVPPKSPVLTGAAGGTGGCIRPPAPKPAPDDDTSQRYSGLVHTRSRPPSWVSSEAEERRSAADIRTDTGDSDQRDVILPGETECSSPEDKKVSTKYSTIDNSTKCERLKKKATSAPGNPPPPSPQPADRERGQHVTNDVTISSVMKTENKFSSRQSQGSGASYQSSSELSYMLNLRSDGPPTSWLDSDADTNDFQSGIVSSDEERDEASSQTGSHPSGKASTRLIRGRYNPKRIDGLVFDRASSRDTFLRGQKPTGHGGFTPSSGDTSSSDSFFWPQDFGTHAFEKDPFRPRFPTNHEISLGQVSANQREETARGITASVTSLPGDGLVEDDDSEVEYQDTMADQRDPPPKYPDVNKFSHGLVCPDVNMTPTKLGRPALSCNGAHTPGTERSDVVEDASRVNQPRRPRISITASIEIDEKCRSSLLVILIAMCFVSVLPYLIIFIFKT